MFEISADIPEYQKNPKGYYRTLGLQLESLLSEHSDMITNMSQTAAFIYQMLPDLNWAGFYRTVSDDLLRLGPFQGKVACVDIPVGQGVCGTAAAEKTTQRIEDVHVFDGHIACDAASQSEIVLPILIEGQLVAVLDLDSPNKARFSAVDQEGLENLVQVFIEQTKFDI